MKPQFHYTLFIAKPAGDVWRALTEKKTIDQYYMAPVHTLEPKAGGKISYGEPTEMVTGSITGFDAPFRLAHTFRFTGREDTESHVVYEITPVGDRMCSLAISHTGFQVENQAFADISQGWPVIASSLKTLLETGQKLPWPKSQEP